MQSESRIVFLDVIAAEIPAEAWRRKSGATRERNARRWQRRLRPTRPTRRLYKLDDDDEDDWWSRYRESESGGVGIEFRRVFDYRFS